MPLDRDTQRRIDRANRGKGIFRTSAPEYYVPVTLLDRVVVRLGAAAFWGAVGCVGVGLGLLAYVYLFHPLVGVAVEWHQPKTGLAWAVVLLLAVPLYGLCWLVVVTVLFALENLFRNRYPRTYKGVRVVLWGIIATAATIAFLLDWQNSLRNLPG